MAVTGAVDRVTLDQLAEYPTPAPTDTWFPIGHSRVMDMVLSTLDMMLSVGGAVAVEQGYHARREVMVSLKVLR